VEVDGGDQELKLLLQAGVVRERTHLHSLLAYLGEQALQGHEEQLKEHRIGVEALRKPPDYDPRTDPSVRVEVAKLRKKLEDYYRGPGASHPVRMTIPKGSYLPVFAPAPPATLPGGGDLPPRRWIVALAGVAAVAAVTTWTVERRTRHRLPSELEAFWGPHFDGNPTLLVYGAPLFLKMQGSFFRNPNVNRPEDFAEDSKTQRVFGALHPEASRPVHTFTGVGEAEALFHITRMLASRGAPVLAERSDTVGFEDLKNRHVIFLGGRKFNPQLPDLPFKPKLQAISRKIVNLEPKGNEPPEFKTASATAHGEIVEEYALISVYPGFTPGTRLIALECSSTEGTLAAAEFLTRADLVRQLLAQGVPVSAGKNGVRAFQAVIGARLNKGVVVDLFYKAHRILS
jgi:hypothetical protein